MKKLIYFHGFGSSAASGTIKTLRDKLNDFEVIAPDIPVDPAVALPYLKFLCEQEKPDIIVGTSMGGMYAQQMYGYYRICVNPAFYMSRTSRMLKVGTFRFFKPRLDGTKEFTITKNTIKNFEEMESKQFDGVTPDECKKVWGMFGDMDDHVSCEDVFKEYYKNVVHFSGGHRLDDQTIEEVLIVLIRQISNVQDQVEQAMAVASELEANINSSKPTNEIYFPWEDVLHSIHEYPEKVHKSETFCPICGNNYVELYFSSPDWTWQQLCGRAGTMKICIGCMRQASFHLEIMN